MSSCLFFDLSFFAIKLHDLNLCCYIIYSKLSSMMFGSLILVYIFVIL